MHGLLYFTLNSLLQDLTSEKWIYVLLSPKYPYAAYTISSYRATYLRGFFSIYLLRVYVRKTLHVRVAITVPFVRGWRNPMELLRHPSLEATMTVPLLEALSRPPPRAVPSGKSSDTSAMPLPLGGRYTPSIPSPKTKHPCLTATSIRIWRMPSTSTQTQL